MTRKCMAAQAFLLAAGMLLCWQVPQAAAQDAQAQPTYTIPEYNAFQACRAETKPDAQVKCLDDFVAKFPKSTLMKYVDQSYVPAYNQLKNYAKVIEYSDKYVAESDPKTDAPGRLAALYSRSAVFEAWFQDNTKAPNLTDQLNKAKAAALDGLKALDTLPKPDNMTAQQFADNKKPAVALFNSVAGFAELQLKDYAAAADAFKAALVNKADDGVSSYRLGVALLQETPPQYMDGFWAMARALALKAPIDPAAIKDYLRKRITAYQQSGCDQLVEPQMNELLQLAATSPDRPATYTIPSAADLDKIRQSSNILSVIADLKGGGDKAKMSWLAICGLDFPEVVGKVIDVTPGTDFVGLHVYTGATSEEMEAATTANMDVKVVGQPESSRLQKLDGVRFSGTLVGYDPDPFMLHWDKAKVNPEDIPPEKAEGNRKPHKVGAKPSGN
jgi:tetratricopeptide (TPR) repeat protein